MAFIVIVCLSLIAGIVQGVTGFGAGIVMMMGFPYFFSLPISAAVSNAIGTILSVSMVITYKDHINYKELIVPTIIYNAVSTICIFISTGLDAGLMKKIFGVFMIGLSIYYLFMVKDGDRQKLSTPVGILFTVFSGACSALFGVGGPLMVIYFMGKTHSTHEYLGTLQAFFLIQGVYNTIVRIVTGILTVDLLPAIGIGFVAIIVGGILAGKIVQKLDGALIKKITYIFIGISGLLNIL
ncbi:MAG: sulfite exporter TauE/SafE family protein [Erysipelotrichaceae bacterium]|nr:sulfite exporter TauE/SafE family protein [Erysipelotrichaceae bacterium]